MGFKRRLRALAAVITVSAALLAATTGTACVDASGHGRPGASVGTPWD